MPLYTPINCNYYDRLEAWATLKERVTIRYKKDGETAETSGVITNLYTRGGVEYLTLNNGLTLRLDTLIAVNGIFLEQAC